MKRELFVGLGLAVALGWAGQNVSAQFATPDTKGKTTTVTGCLAKGADATTYTLSDATPAAAAATAAKEQPKDAAKSAEAKSYTVMAKDSSLKLADHVGHRVTLTGTVEEMAFSPKADAAKPGAPGTSGAAKPAATTHLMVTSMKHVAPTCTP
jgi:hypothetical protein